MKILRIYTKLPPLKGGMEKHIYNLTKLQIRDNHFVKVFFNDGEEISQNDEKICKLKLHRLKPQIIGFFIFYFLIVFKLLLKKQKFDIIHIHGDWSSLLFIKLLKKFTNAKLVVLSLHGQLTSKYNHQKLLPKLVQDVDLIYPTWLHYHFFAT
jgi:glycosyltransferase involved in cell wall biosynthesis